MIKLIIPVIALAAVAGCGPSESEVKAQTTKEWQDRSTVPEGYRQASAAGSPAPPSPGAAGGPPAMSGPVNPPPGAVGR